MHTTSKRMFQKTNNPYEFKYIITGIRGEGIKEVYLPEVPKSKSQILDFGGKWVKQPLPSAYEDWHDWENERNLLPSGKYRKDKRGIDIDFYHDEYEWHPDHLAFANQEWDRRINGVWIYLTQNGQKKPFYLTGLYYFILQWWKLDFEYKYMDSQREVFYWIQYWEEDPASMGGIYGTRRQVSKSVTLGAWAFERTSRVRNAQLGMQGESDKKIKKFYEDKIRQGFLNIQLDFFIPRYDMNGFQTGGIKFQAQKKRNQRLKQEELDSALNSSIDYGIADINYYNSATLTGYVGEEPGKVEEVNIYERHDAVKPALMRRKGKAFYGSTADTISEKTMNNYKKLVLQSDFSKKKENGQTLSGLYFMFLPAHHAGGTDLSDPMDGFDEYGFPTSEKNHKAIMSDREYYKDDPKKYSSLCRQFPTTISEYFYTSGEKCQFNLKVLQDTLQYVDENENHTTRVDFATEGGLEDGNIYFEHSAKGACLISAQPEPNKRNLVLDNGKHAGKYRFSPLNDSEYCMGTDPIDYGTTVSGKSSTPVIYVKRKYNPLLEGELTPAVMLERKLNKYAYQTGVPVCRYAYRPTDPYEYYEYVIKLCRFYGCKIHIEKTRGMGLIRYMEERGYADFVMIRPDITRTSTRYEQAGQGTSASMGLTQIYTGLIARDVDYFGHCYPFRDQLDDLLHFDPKNTLEHDDSVAWGFTLLAEYDDTINHSNEEYDLTALNRWGGK